LITQADRPLRIKTTLGEDVLVLENLQGSESISRPFLYNLKLLSENPSIALKDLLKSPVVISIELLDGSLRHLHGNISRISQLALGEDGLAAYQAEVVPWLWFLSLFSDCRIFQNKSVPEIVQQVFKDRGFTDFKLQLQGTYPKRDYCVQYRETDLNFISRLLEDEGIFYFFQHDDQKHTLILADALAAIKDCPAQASARYMPLAGGLQDDDTITTLENEQNLRAGTASLNDYDFEKPGTSLRSLISSDRKGEIYDYPGKYTTKDDGSRYSRIRLEEQEVGLSIVRGDSSCRAFQAGYRFDLKDHYRADANRCYTLVSVAIEAHETSYRSGSDEGFRYRNSFYAIPNSIPFRPPRVARKPVIEGSQTAVVVGKSGEEIWTDQYGRVKVQFFWDRAGKKDENSSCWIRVAQLWAGKGWGAIYTPRIGQEVIVDFLEGDPDRPIITGRVYNADQTVPYALPGEQTKSTIKSMSSKGGDGFNEIRLEDKKGEEQVFIHGEKDLEIRVKNDRKEWIGQDRHLQVVRDKLEKIQRDSHSNITRDEVEKIGRDHHLEITGKEAIKVGGSHSFTVQGDVMEEFHGNHSSQVTQSLYIKGMNVVIEGATELTIKVGGNFIDINPGGIFIKGTMVMINSGGAAGSGSPGSIVSPITPAEALEAVKADPGALTTAVAADTVGPASMALAALAPRVTSPTHNPDSPENQDKTHWVEIKLVDEDGNPVPGETYQITLPDGSTIADGTLDEKGFARVDHIDPGTCKVTFPNLDKDAWEPK
jgi:type VI secretion system secreted protein VgrG